ncbi:MAG: hypothetical protein MUE85_01090 [Microscillaceae bacterium]|jgi:hypothetical protein|nr:hypothetical protein [Microscillaceae bacterium]
MANRVYLYATNEERTKINSLSEWRSEIPLTYKILLSGNPILQQSIIWNGEDLIALRGDFAEGYHRLKQFLILLYDQPDMVKFGKYGTSLEAEISQTILFLEDAEQNLPYFWLEPSEAFLLYASENELEVLTKSLWRECIHTGQLIDKLLEAKSNNLFAQDLPDYILNLKDNWENSLGLYWSKVLFFQFK